LPTGIPCGVPARPPRAPRQQPREPAQAASPASGVLVDVPVCSEGGASSIQPGGPRGPLRVYNTYCAGMSARLPSHQHFQRTSYDSSSFNLLEADIRPTRRYTQTEKASSLHDGYFMAAALTLPAVLPGSWAVRRPLTNQSVKWTTSLDTDSSLVERCLSGDETAWEDLVRLHTRRVYAVCYRFTGTDAEAQDLTQDVFVRVFRSLKSFRSGEGSFTVWLMRLTRNLLIDHYRRSRPDRRPGSLPETIP